MGADMTIEQVAGADVFAARALSVLLGRMGASTRELESLRAAIERGVLDPAVSAGHDARLGSACAQVEQQGWLFGLVARELGSDVLFERRERHGLRMVLQLVSDMLTAEGRLLTHCDTPELDSSDARATDLCAVVARCVYAARSAQPSSGWSLLCMDAATWLCFEAPRSAALEFELIAGAARIDGSRLVAREPHWRLLLPSKCVVWP
jgi:hypothetical protein